MDFVIGVLVLISIGSFIIKLLGGSNTKNNKGLNEDERFNFFNNKK